VDDLRVGKQAVRRLDRLPGAFLGPAPLAGPLREVAHDRVEQARVGARAPLGPLEEPVEVESAIGEQVEARVERLLQRLVQVRVVRKVAEVLGLVRHPEVEVHLRGRGDIRVSTEQRLDESGPTALVTHDEDGRAAVRHAGCGAFDRLRR
jgi:hypothetical protein